MISLELGDKFGVSDERVSGVWVTVVSEFLKHRMEAKKIGAMQYNTSACSRGDSSLLTLRGDVGARELIFFTESAVTLSHAQRRHILPHALTL